MEQTDMDGRHECPVMMTQCLLHTENKQARFIERFTDLTGNCLARKLNAVKVPAMQVWAAHHSQL